MRGLSDTLGKDNAGNPKMWTPAFLWIIFAVFILPKFAILGKMDLVTPNSRRDTG